MNRQDQPGGDPASTRQNSLMPRRRFLQMAAGIAAIGLTGESLTVPAADLVELPFANGRRELVRLSQKGKMILLRERPPLLETPFEVFDRGVLTPNDQFFVRWHLSAIPPSINPDSFRLHVDGHVRHPIGLSLRDLMGLPEVQLTAVNQCSGNSRGFFNPRVPGGQWGNGAMGNAVWTGVTLKTVLERAGVLPGAVQVRFRGLDFGKTPETPVFLKSLAIDHALDGEVIIAYGMNRTQLPLLNGFPLRLIVPGWYSTYWVKMLSHIEVLDHPDENFWMHTAYLIPDTPDANTTPEAKNVKMVPINRMVPRSFITNLQDNQSIRAGQGLTVRGIAFGGDAGVKGVAFSNDGGTTWRDAILGRDLGRYSFRRWEIQFTPNRPGAYKLMVKATNTNGLTQPAVANWNLGGYMRNVIETVAVNAA